MSAKRHVNPNQLQMFMPAGHIKEKYPSVDGDLELYPAGTDPNYLRLVNKSIMTEKLHKANTNGLRANIERRGVETPVRIHRYTGGKESPIGHGFLGNGGHRVAVMADIDPKAEVPVEHDEEFYDVPRWRRGEGGHGEVSEYAGWADRTVRANHGA